MLEFHITHAGRSALASAAVRQEAIAVSSVVLTDGETESVLADIVVKEDLGGMMVFNGAAAGKLINEGTIQIESFDTSDSVYQAKTAAILFRDASSGDEKVFAVATSSEVEVYKTQFTSASIIFALELNASDAIFISFEALEANFPPATETSLGAVQICESDQINGDAWTLLQDPLTPVVATPYAVESALQNALGSSVFSGPIALKDTLEVGRKERVVYDSGWELESGNVGYESDFVLTLGSNFDWRRAINVRGTYSTPSSSGSLYGVLGTSYHDGKRGFLLLDTFEQTLIGQIFQSSNTWKMRITSTGYENSVALYLRGTGTTDAIQTNAHTLSAETAIISDNVTVGGFTELRLRPQDYIKRSDSLWVRYDVKLTFVGSRIVDEMYLMIDEERVDGVYDSSSGIMTFGESGFTLNNEGLRYSPEYPGDEPPDCYLYYTKPGTVSASHAVMAYGYDVMRSHGCLGWVKFGWNGTSGGLSILSSYQITLTYTDGVLRATFTMPSGASDLRSVVLLGSDLTKMLMFEMCISTNALGSGTYTDRSFKTEYDNSVDFSFDSSRVFTGILRVY